MATGLVKFFNLDKGFGFITPDDGGDEIFAHQRNIVGAGFRYLLPGEPVEYDSEFDQAKERFQATNIRPRADRLNGVVMKYNHSKGFGFIRPDGEAENVFFHYSAILKQTESMRASAEEGERVQFSVILGTDGRKQATKVKREDSRLPLFRFADMGPDDKWLASLASKAESEVWQHSQNPSKFTNYPILKSYLTHTFSRIEQEDLSAPGRKIALGRDGHKALACFNTGLVTKNQEELFALFESKQPGNDSRSWRLFGFHVASDHEVFGKFERLPDLADYFDDPSVLLYDRRAELYIDIDHVLDDNLWRFPKELQENKHLARNMLLAARTQTQQRVYRNYKTAVPQFHRGEVQLLLPLCLLEPNVPDLALVVSRKEIQASGNSHDTASSGRHASSNDAVTSTQEKLYRGETVLTLDMAYNNARLICRPDSDWLKP